MANLDWSVRLYKHGCVNLLLIFIPHQPFAIMRMPSLSAGHGLNVILEETSEVGKKCLAITGIDVKSMIVNEFKRSNEKFTFKLT